MKKFMAVLVVLALTLFTTAAFAEISVSGSYDIRSRNYNNAWDWSDNWNDNDATTVSDSDHEARTQSRVRLTIDGKAGDATARIQLENDWDNWGRFESPMGNAAGGGTAGFMDLREAWISFKLPGMPLNVKAGHMLAQLGNGWFVRSNKYGSDGWIVSTQMGPMTFALVDVKVTEGATVQPVRNADDWDLYSVIAAVKMSDTMSAALDLTEVHMRGSGGDGDDNLQNVGVSFNGDMGPVKLAAEVDMQMGKDKTDPTEVKKYKGNQIVAQAQIGMDPITISATVARGSGDKNPDPTGLLGVVDTKDEGFHNFLDADPHYTLLYEYNVATAANATLAPKAYGTTLAAGANVKNTGFSNTTAIGAGVMAKLGASLAVGADVWMLKATEKVENAASSAAAGSPVMTDDLGNELDVKINWKLADNLTWNWTLGLFMPGDAYKVMDVTMGVPKDADDVTGIQGVLSMKF